MDIKEINERLAAAKRTAYSSSALPHHYEAALKNLRYVNKFLEKDDLRAHELMGKIHYLMGNYYLSIQEYEIMLSVDNDNLKALIGLYKINVLMGNYKQALEYLKRYSDIKKNNNIEVDISLIDVLITYINNKKLRTITYPSKFIAYDLNMNLELKKIIYSLIDAINDCDFYRAIELADACDSFARANNLYVEFFVLRELLKEVLKVYEVEFRKKLQVYNKELNVAVYNVDINKILELLNIIKDYDVYDEYVVLKALFILVANDHTEEALSLISSFSFTKASKEKLKLLKNIIDEKLFLLVLSGEQLNAYEEAIKKGREFYRNGKLMDAYDIYSWGLYVTDAPIFLYYIGKILYKMNRLKEAKDYLLKYIEVGGIKIDKAYLYLTKIYERYGKKKEARKCANRVNIYNNMLGSDFYIFTTSNDPDYDYKKAQAQKTNKIDERLFSNEYTARIQEFRRLFSSGNVEYAETLIAELEQKENKTNEDCVVLSIVKKNKTLFINSRISV